MSNESKRVYGYHWFVPAAFMLVTLLNQAWITFAPITSEAARYYRSSELMIGLLSITCLRRSSARA